jgi:hypothetical protein
MDSFIDAVTRLDPINFWFTFVGGVLFAFLPFWQGTSEDSDWRAIILWGVWLYLAYFLLLNLHRFAEGQESATFHLVSSVSRWAFFICTAVITTGTLRWLRKRRGKHDDLS